MSTIPIVAYTSDEAVRTVRGMLRSGFEAKTARISYNVDKGLPNAEDTENYPLILKGTLNGSSLTVPVYSVTAGYGGTGPNAMVRILNEAGFKFKDSDILTKELVNSDGQIDLFYTRD